MIEMEKGTGTATSYTYSQYCSFRLPCGICTRTNTTCPIAIPTTPYSPWWGIYPPTITTQTGTSATINSKDYMATGETTATGMATPTSDPKFDAVYERGEWKKGD